MLVRRAILTAAILSLPAAAVPVSGEQEVLAWYPLNIGNRWIYRMRESTQGASAGKIETVTWIHEERVKEHRRTPEGLLILIEEHDSNARGGQVPQRFHHDYLIRGHDVYEINESHWLPDKSSLRPIDAAQDEPAFRFPLRTGMKWAESSVPRDDNMYCWYVNSREGNTYKLVYMTLPDRTDLSFRRGIGVVATSYSHHGTFHEQRSRLLRFVRARPARPSTSRPR